MLRDGTAANARYVGLTFQGVGGSLGWTRRTTAGGSVSTTSVSLPPGPRWLRITRAGNNFSAWHSADGVAWQQVGATQALTVPISLRAGVATTSGNTQRPARGLFSSVQVSGRPENTAPQVQTALTSTSSAAFATLSGVVEDDWDAAPVVSWSVVSSPGDVVFTDPSSASTTARFTRDGTHRLRLTADDGEAVSFSEVTLDVQRASLSFGSITAANEEGATPGHVVLTRSGIADLPLTVNYSVGGTATAPQDFQSLPGSVTFGPGETEVEIPVLPQADDLAEGSETVVISLLPDSTYHLPSNPTASIAILEGSLEAWRFSQFGPQANDSNVSDLLADPDHDTWNNLLEYALNLRAARPDASPLTHDFTDVGDQRFLRLTVPKNPDAVGLTYTVQATSNLLDPNSWSSEHLHIEEDSATSLRVRDHIPLGPGVTRFMRVRVVATDP
jgi:hypothetical protein